MDQKITTILFDFDGVVADTEPQYDIFSEQLVQKYKHLPSDFALQCRGVTLDRTLNRFFTLFSDEEKRLIREESDRYELEMDYPLVSGILEFIQYLKSEGYKVGLVTSSPKIKMKYALQKLKLKETFDTMVTADRVTEGKPDPMCYLLAAKDLDVDPGQCIVFEDSLFGLKAATRAGMRTVGVATSFDERELREVSQAVIPDFRDIEQIRRLLI